MLAEQSNAPFKVLAEFTSGNALGIIVEPLTPDPKTPIHKQQIVKIGPLDPELALRLPFAREDFLKVIEQLRDYLGSTGTVAKEA